MTQGFNDVRFPKKGITPKDKAEELVDKFYGITFPDGYVGMTIYESVQCSIICVEEIIPLLDDDINADNMYRSADYWYEVLTALKAMQ